MNKILLIGGSRPELIKLSPLYKSLLDKNCFQTSICITGQQKDLLHPLKKELDITADYEMDVMHSGQTLNELSQKILTRLPNILQQSSPDLVIIQGDTISAACGAIAAHNMNIDIAHVEAGLRTYDRNAPFPEEGLRCHISKIAKLHFCPTKNAQQNLLNEKIDSQHIYITGNTALDILHETREKNKNKSFVKIRPEPRRPYFIITLHRREIMGQKLLEILTTLSKFADNNPNYDFIIPLHPDPYRRIIIKAIMTKSKNIYFTQPLGYSHFINLMEQAYAIITDSGGVQEEAPSLNTPVLIIRDKTERFEAIEAGCNILLGTDPTKIIEGLNLIIENKALYKRLCLSENPFGDGNAALHITQILQNYFKRTTV